MAGCPLSILPWQRLQHWTKWQAAWRGWKKGGASEPSVQAEVGPAQNDRGGTQPVGRTDRLRQAHAAMGLGRRAYSGWELGQAWATIEQSESWTTLRSLAQAVGP